MSPGFAVSHLVKHFSLQQNYNDLIETATKVKLKSPNKVYNFPDKHYKCGGISELFIYIQI